MRYAILRSLLLLLLCSGCDSPWRSRFPIGTRLYEPEGHRYFGKVVGYDDQHDFANGTSAGPAILIEPEERGYEPVWGACATCSTLFEVEKP
jgi:hypothetical protein